MMEVKRERVVKLLVNLSESTDRELRAFVAERSGGRKGLLSYVVERAIKEYLERHSKDKELWE